LENNFSLHATNMFFLLFHFFLHYEFSWGNSVVGASIFLDNSLFFELDIFFYLKRKGVNFILLLVVFTRLFLHSNICLKREKWKI
jgi:hypothetical protein